MWPSSSDVITKQGPGTPGSGQKSKMTAEVKQIVEEQMEKNDETTERELQKLTLTKHCSVQRCLELT